MRRNGQLPGTEGQDFEIFEDGTEEEVDSSWYPIRNTLGEGQHNASGGEGLRDAGTRGAGVEDAGDADAEKTRPDTVTRRNRNNRGANDENTPSGRGSGGGGAQKTIAAE